MPCFQELNLDFIQSGDGKKIARDFYIPVLKTSKEYDRISGYFSVDALVITATGIAGLIENEGKMRLILGAHDFGGGVLEAYKLSKERGKELVDTIGQKIADKLETIEDTLTKNRIEAIAWMLVEKKLEIKIAIPKRTFNRKATGIFHEKSLIFKDKDGCIITAGGSTNESRAAWDANGENIVAFPSWNSGVSEYITRHQEQFGIVWDNIHPDYFTFTLPEAVQKKLSQRFYRPEKPKFDPYEDPEIIANEKRSSKLAPAARLIQELGSVKEVAHLGLGPVLLYPHQAFTVERVLDRFPFRVLLADEVGLGKTLEAGAIVKRLIETGVVKRVCILTPKNVSRQWLDELWVHFNLNFSLLQSNPKSFTTAEGVEHPLNRGENPFDKPGFDRVIASWHYARGTGKDDPEILQASKFFDLIIIDEAHAARRKWSQDPPKDTKLKSLADQLSATSPHILLMTATPLQIEIKEALDMLEILGLGGKWTHESNFEKYYKIIQQKPEDVSNEDWKFGIKLASYLCNYIVDDEKLKRTVIGIIGDGTNANSIIRMLKTGDIRHDEFNQISRIMPEKICELLIAFNPMKWFMIRNTREDLQKRNKVLYHFPKRKIKQIDVDLDDEHQKLLDKLDEYLRTGYGKYEKLVKPENKGVIGFIKTIYHQRFVSSMYAAFKTVENRHRFLNALLSGDDVIIRKETQKLLDDVDSDEDEDDVIQVYKDVLQSNQSVIRGELSNLEKLKDMLRPYSELTKDDPKLVQIFKTTKKEIDDKRSKVLIFSKYVDTVVGIRKFFEKKQLSKSRTGLYTGNGGEIFDTNSREYKLCSKERVKTALEDDEIDVLICTDAAAEGLNLQAASVIINADMPWNPAKIEQRIGRVDRLGQKANEVNVYNIWYPNSIEARMYKIIFERTSLYKLVVGPAQDIIGRALKDALSTDARDKELEKIVKDVTTDLNNQQQSLVEQQGLLSGMSWDGKSTDDFKLIQLVKKFATLACDSLDIQMEKKDNKLFFNTEEELHDLERWNGAALEIGKSNLLTPSHPIIQELAHKISMFENFDHKNLDYSLYSVKDHNGLADLVYIKEGLAPEQIHAKKAISLLEDMLEFAQ